MWDHINPGQPGWPITKHDLILAILTLLILRSPISLLHRVYFITPYIQLSLTQKHQSTEESDNAATVNKTILRHSDDPFSAACSFWSILPLLWRPDLHAWNTSYLLSEIWISNNKKAVLYSTNTTNCLTVSLQYGHFCKIMFVQPISHLCERHKSNLFHDCRRLNTKHQDEHKNHLCVVCRCVPELVFLATLASFYEFLQVKRHPLQYSHYCINFCSL